jgi:DNA-binding MarR family transcriptional regulator
MPPWVPWMNEVDKAILYFLATIEPHGEELPAEDTDDYPLERVALTSTAIYTNVVTIRGESDKVRSTFSRRVDRLEEMGLVRRLPEKENYVQLTDDGLRWVTGEMDRDEVPELDE